jgi:predicted dehydrogenase
MLDFGNSCFVTVDATFNAVASRSPQMELFGSAGTLIVNRPGTDPLTELFRLDAAPRTSGWITPTDVGFPRNDRSRQLQRAVLLEHLLDCLDTGDDPILSAAHARHVLEIMLAAQTSAATGRVVELETTFAAASTPNSPIAEEHDHA